MKHKWVIAATFSLGAAAPSPEMGNSDLVWGTTVVNPIGYKRRVLVIRDVGDQYRGLRSRAARLSHIQLVVVRLPRRVRWYD